MKADLSQICIDMQTEMILPEAQNFQIGTMKITVAIVNNNDSPEIPVAKSVYASGLQWQSPRC